MVERISKPMEPLEPTSSSQLDKDNVRCLILGLTSSLQRCNHRGPWYQDETSYYINYLEMLAAFLALQSFTKDLLHPFTVFFTWTTPQQFLTSTAGEGDLAMVHVLEHLTSSQPPSRTPQCSSRYRV